MELKSKIIDFYKIKLNNNTLAKITFESTEKVAREIQKELIVSSDFWDDLQLDFHNYPIVISTIYCKHEANMNFLELHYISEIFKQNMI